MGGGGDSTTVRETTEIPREFRPYYTRLFNRAETASGLVPSTPYGGPFVAAPDPLQLESLAQRERFARQFPGGGAEALLGLGEATARGEFLTPESNPYLEAYAQAATRPVEEQFVEDYNALNAAAQSAGAFDNIRRQFEILDLGGTTQKNIGDIRASIFSPAYQFERGMQLHAPALLEAGARFGQLPSEILGQVGDVRRGFAQEQVEADIARFEEQAAAPFRPLFPLASILSQSDVGTERTRVQTGGTGGPSRAALGITGALGGAASGAAIGDLIHEGGATGTDALIGAILGGGAGILY